MFLYNKDLIGLTIIREISALDRLGGAYLGEGKWFRLQQTVKLAQCAKMCPVHAFKQQSQQSVTADLFLFVQAGCVHFPPVPQCDVKVLLLIFSPKKRAFVGLIPIEQVIVDKN